MQNKNDICYQNNWLFLLYTEKVYTYESMVRRLEEKCTRFDYIFSGLIFYYGENNM
jgi:hypothetical protein